MSGDEIITITVTSADGKNKISTSYSLLQADLYQGGPSDYHLAALDLALSRLEKNATMKQNPKCGCRKCNPRAWWMVTCGICGNKRCPRASDHAYQCTGSNEPGQPGSVFK